MKDSDKQWLAEFAGLELRPSTKPELVEFYHKVRGNPFCVITDWSPDTNPAHGDLVLRALVKRISADIEFYSKDSTCSIQIWKWEDNPKEIHAPWWPEAVCKAAEIALKTTARP